MYAAGNFDSASGVIFNNIAKWDNSKWAPLETSAGINHNGEVKALAFDSSENLYAGGNFTAAGTVSVKSISKWYGTSWSALGSGIDYPPYTVSTVNSLVVGSSGTILYAGGFFTKAGDVTANNIAKWNGVSWTALGTGLDRDDAYAPAVYALAVDKSDNLYVGGSFTIAGDVRTKRIAKWNGSSWSALGTGIDDIIIDSYTYEGQVYAFAVDKSGNLYVDGNFTSVSDVAANYIAKWNGTSWSALGTGTNYKVNALAIDSSGNLYAGGYFTEAGGVPANNIAKWDGTSWNALGTGMDYEVEALAIDGADNLYMGGSFTTAGGYSQPYC